LDYCCDELRLPGDGIGAREITDPLKQKDCFAEASGCLRSGDAQAAAELCESGLKAYPGDGNLLCLSAKANLALRRFAEARSRVEEAIRLFPDFADAHETFGDLLFVEGHLEAAVEAYRQALRLDSTKYGIRPKLDKVRNLLSEPDQAPEARSRPGKQEPRRRMAFEEEIGRALVFAENGEPDKAEDIYRDILKRDPNHVEAARLLAEIAVQHKRYNEAEVFLLRVVSNAPDYGRAWVELSNVQRELHKYEEAEQSARQILKLGPNNPESYMILAGVVGTAGRHEEAIEHYRRAIEIDGNKAVAFSGMAHHLKTIGRQDEAVENYRKSVAVKADHTEAYWGLANLKTFRFEDAEIETMETLLSNEELADRSREHLHNALGLAYEGRKDYDSAFEHFETCNTIRRKSESYDPVEMEENADRIIETFDAEFFERRCDVGYADESPILIVGLPRSGSTLIEQILSSHSEIEGTHELPDLDRSLQKTRRAARTKRFPEGVAAFEVADWAQLGREYIERTRKYRGGCSYFVDKNPNNFNLVGVLSIALPNAKIINARRHPLDSCFGSYKQLFASGQPFTYDLTEIGEYYLQYLRLMDHWHKILPGKVLDVQYEEVVADLDGQVRRILDYCGLPFEEACLRFYETERAIKTASSEQVRRPIYSTSVNLWRNYEEHLGELIQVLEPLLENLPEGDRPKTLALNKNTRQAVD
jgi:tetratricopeptide (TPR) repeat protein